MMKRLALPLVSVAAFAAVVATPLIAHAQRRSPLEDAPAIRHRVELRDLRFEAGAAFGTTINETFYHGMMANIRLAFHLTDWLSISGMGAFNVAALGTGFNDRLTAMDGGLPADEAMRSENDRRAPLRADALRAMNKMSMVLGAQAELTPFTGKFSLFGALFSHYDFYLFGGAAFVNLAAANSGPAPACTDNPAANGYCLVSGFKPGGTFGVGFHAFFNDFVGFQAELRDVLIQDNPAGRDVNGDQQADTDDLTWTSHLMAFFGVTVYLPAKAPISD